LEIETRGLCLRYATKSRVGQKGVSFETIGSSFNGGAKVLQPAVKENEPRGQVSYEAHCLQILNMTRNQEIILMELFIF
jgi:hypothetical protein